MQKKSFGYSSLIGILAAASGILAPRAFAVGWCPSASDYNITCSNCSPTSSAYFYVKNVNVYGSKHHGIYGAGTTFTDVYTTTVGGNGFHGFVITKNYFYAKNNTIYSNIGFGATASGVAGLQIQNNQFLYNYRGLQLSNTSAPWVVNNSGSWNTTQDCADAGSTNGTHYGNGWAVAYGTNCTP